MDARPTNHARPCRRGVSIYKGANPLPKWAPFSLALAVITQPAHAQDQRPTGYPRSANEQTDRGVNLSVVYTGEVRGVVAGGIDRGARYLDNLDLQVALDAERLIGWHGARFFLYGIYNNGQSLSPALVGDLQGISNIETGVRAARLFEAWIEQDVGSRASIRVGLYNLNAEFDTTQSGGLFLLSSHGIGADYAQSGRRGPSIFPVTSLALRGEMAISDNLLARVAILDGVPGDDDDPGRTAIKLSQRDGALITGELDFLRGGLKAGIGGWAYTAPASLPVSDKATRQPGDRGVYAYGEFRLVGDRSDDPEGLAGWLRVGAADKRSNAVERYLGGGLVYTGALPGRSKDQAGISFAMASLGSRFRRAEAESGAALDRHELIAELAYQAVVTPWLSLQPDLQYVINPGGSRAVSDAVVLGLRVKVGR
jgi:porin